MTSLDELLIYNTSAHWIFQHSIQLVSLMELFVIKLVANVVSILLLFFLQFQKEYPKISD